MTRLILADEKEGIWQPQEYLNQLSDNKHHWFLGSGMVHGVRLRGGRAEWHRNRWVRSKAVAEALGEKWREGPIHDHDFAANTHILAMLRKACI